MTTTGYVKAQATIRTDGRESVTIKLIGYTPDDLDAVIAGIEDDAARRIINLARHAERRRRAAQRR